MAIASGMTKRARAVVVDCAFRGTPERPLPASTLDEAKQRIDELERWVRRKHKSGWTPSNKPTAPAKATAAAKPSKRSDAIPDDEANILIRKFLEQHPKATARDVAEGVGIALGRVSKMAAWRAEIGRRKAVKSPPKKTAIPLTKKMTVSSTSSCSPSPKNRCGKILSGMLGKALNSGEELDTGSLIGQTFLVVVRKGENGGTFVDSVTKAPIA